MLYQGNSLQILKQLDDNSVDSVVTDPPYGLSFMGKKWDYDVPSKELWEEVYRVLKPGGHLLSFAGTRTQHRMAVNIEDAGFEIRDMIAWVYGSGFPKSLNIGKAVDRIQGNEREVTGTISSQDITSGGLVHKKYSRVDVEVTKGTSEWEGWGTALKPALEPITVARKPISEKNIAENVLKWGTGGLNIDGTRVGVGSDKTKAPTKRNESASWFTTSDKTNLGGDDTVGRFPANLIHDGSDEVTELLGDASRFFYCAKASKSERNKGLEGFEKRENAGSYEFRTDGSLDGKSTEPKANHHPTVKPVKLMQYLVRLVTPKGGTVLDPFMGSGTTGIACKLEDFKFIGIEREEEYIEIAKARIVAWELSAQEKLL